MTYIVLVLVSFGLVLLATILLVVGLLTDDGLTLIYVSIAASFTAAVVLYLAFRKARPTADTDLQPPAPIAPEITEEEAAAARADRTTVAPAVTTPEAVVAATEGSDDADELAETVPVGAGASAAADDWTSDDDWADDGDFDAEFPIADYDDLSVAEIMPLLPQLYSDELGVVAERERQGQGRAAILARLDELAATGTTADALEADSLDAEATPEPEPMPSAAAAAAAAVGARDETLSTPRPPARTPSPAPQVPSLAADDEYDSGYVFPIADYDELSVDQIVPLLAQLEDDELEEVKEREVAGQGRRTVIAEIDRQLGLVEASAPDLADDGWADEPATAASARPAAQAESVAGSVLAIAGYDGLTVAQIRPLLSGLSAGELRAVLDHEVARDNRSTIVADIHRRLNGSAPELPAAPAPAPAAKRAPRTPARKAPARKAAATKKAAATTSTTKRAAAKKATRTAKKAATPRFPIADYDSLTVAQIRPRLSDLSTDQLLQVRAREERGAGRKTILNEIASRLG